MFKNLEEYTKQRDYVICIDSDGTAMDTMDIKHKKCFGPLMIEAFELQSNQAAILARWNEINLYSLTRGINRFKGLSKALTEVNVQYQKIKDIDALNKFATASPELSNKALEKELLTNPCDSLRRALEWSEKVNEAIQSLSSDEKISFPGVKETLEKASRFADIIVLSSANREAVVEEWEKEELLPYVSLIFAQDDGSKQDGLEAMLSKGYDKNKILMVGDAPADLEATRKTSVPFYPILVKHEEESWAKLNSEFLHIFEMEKFADYAVQLENEFKENLTPSL